MPRYPKKINHEKSGGIKTTKKTPVTGRQELTEYLCSFAGYICEIQGKHPTLRKFIEFGSKQLVEHMEDM